MFVFEYFDIYLGGFRKCVSKIQNYCKIIPLTVTRWTVLTHRAKVVKPLTQSDLVRFVKEYQRGCRLAFPELLFEGTRGRNMTLAWLQGRRDA